jgi:hypothetical protein
MGDPFDARFTSLLRIMDNGSIFAANPDVCVSKNEPAVAYYGKFH